MEQIHCGVATITQTAIDMHIKMGPAAVVNDRYITSVIQEAAAAVLGPEQVDYIPKPSMGGEDFADYLQPVPGCMLRLGVASECKRQHFPHSPRFDIDERALAPLDANILARTFVLLAKPTTAC